MQTPGQALPDAVRLDQVSKVYGRGEGAVIALDRVSLGLSAREFHRGDGAVGLRQEHVPALRGRVGQAVVGLGTAGRRGVDRSEKEKSLTVLRREKIGFIFQAFNLLPALTVTQNITLPLRLAGRRANPKLVADVIARVGLTRSRRKHLPGELSGGQQQRVAIARALVTRPAVMFADEPTGALDTRTGRDVLELMRNSVRTQGQTVVMVTHDPMAASFADRVVFLADGQFVDHLDNPTAEAVAERMTHLGA